MTTQFLERVRRESVVDTRRYRYIIDRDVRGYSIKRLPLIFLDTIYSITAWDTIATIDEMGIHKKEGVR